MKRFAAMAGLLALAACASPGEYAPARSDHPLFDRLSAHCGQAYEGRVTSDDPRDADWAREVLTIHVRECSETEVRIPLHVGENRSRTWVIRRNYQQAACSQPGLRGMQMSHDCAVPGLALTHIHRHEDGEEDVLSRYGGHTYEAGPRRAEFPADQFSRELFVREGIPDSAQNTWSLTVTETELVYALDRPNRHFEARFDLTRPVEAPPPPWGDE